MPDKRIGFVVLPQAHGKSFRHDPSARLVEAESIVPVRSTTQLDALRTEAELTGNWREFDREWTKTVHASLVPGHWIVMVPKREIGLVAGWTYLGAACLEYDAWEQNLRYRKGSIDSYRSIYDDAINIGATIHSSNKSIDRWLEVILREW